MSVKTQKFSNKLTDAELERLALLNEECAEICWIVSKIIRHGYESYNPFDDAQTPNRELLEREIGDLRLALDLMIGTDIDVEIVEHYQKQKAINIKPYLHHN